MSGKRLISVDREFRIIVTERRNYKDVTRMDIGTPTQIYRG